MTAETFKTPEDNSALQNEDKILKPLFVKVATESDTFLGSMRFIIDEDVPDGDHRRLVVPTTGRPLITHLAHTLPSTLILKSIVQHSLLARKLPLQTLPDVSTPFRRIAMNTFFA